MKKFKTGILVGSKMVSKMESLGIKVHYRNLSDEEYRIELKNKMIEEAKELAKETEKQKLIDELADIKEVFECIQKEFEISKEEINQAQKEKVQSKGSYVSRHFTEFLEIDEDNPAINYYMSKEDKYPQI